MRLGRFPSATGALVYRDLLLPLSLAPEHDRIFAIAVRLAEPGRARIRLLHVIETIPGLEEGELDAFYASLRERAERALAAWRSALGAQGLEVDTEIRFGKRGPTIVAAAVEHRCDLIVLTSHAADPERPDWGFGSTSHGVALTAPCSVLLVR